MSSLLIAHEKESHSSFVCLFVLFQIMDSYLEAVASNGKFKLQFLVWSHGGSAHALVGLLMF